MKRNNSKRKTRRGGRKGQLLNVWIMPEQKQSLKSLAQRTRVNQSELVRRALEILFEYAEKGHLRLGFPPTAERDTIGAPIADAVSGFEP